MNHLNITSTGVNRESGGDPASDAQKVFDLAVIGGGVNGCGIARDASGRGASVILLEQGDLAGATSSASTKLIHGGLRYLEYFELRLVREALRERAVLWRMAPHIVRPMRFVLPHHVALRPRWMLRLGLFMYDHLGARGGLAPARSLDLHADPAGAPLKPAYAKGFEYSDCWVDDARLVVLNALDAAERGCEIRTRSRVVSAGAEAGLWRLEVEDQDGRRTEIRARALVNAAGPWVAEVAQLAGARKVQRVRLVKGSHIVVPRCFDHGRSYIFQNGDGRVVFAIPYEDDFTLIGTTDKDWPQAAGEVRIDADEIAYLCDAASGYFRAAVKPEDVVWSFAGVRPLVDDGSDRPESATRDYQLVLDAGADRPPLLSVYGGKITTYRRLAEAVLRQLAPYAPRLAGAAWTSGAALPGGDFPPDGLAAAETELRAAHPYLAPRHAARLIRAYGRRAFALLDGAAAAADLGEIFLADLSAREVAYLMAVEWARTADDVLWRRSKLGLRASPAEAARLEAFMATATPNPGPRRRAHPTGTAQRAN